MRGSTLQRQPNSPILRRCRRAILSSDLDHGFERTVRSDLSAGPNTVLRADQPDHLTRCSSATEAKGSRRRKSVFRS